MVEDDDEHAQDLRQLGGGQPVQDDHGHSHLVELGQHLGSAYWSQSNLALPIVEELLYCRRSILAFRLATIRYLLDIRTDN